MGKLIAILALINLSVLEICSFAFSSNPLMWLASPATSYEITRAILIVLLVALAVTNPPRNVLLRIAVGVLAAGVLVSALLGTFVGNMPVLDSLTLLAASVAMGIMAFEINPDDDSYVDIETLRQVKRGGRIHAH
jgi:hypothetical protein